MDAGLINFLLQAGVVIFSLLAAWFWMTSALGRTIGSSQQPSRPVAPADLPAHQAYWNARAALCAAGAAVFQALAFLYRYYV
jgi:hypothetical protein